MDSQNIDCGRREMGWVAGLAPPQLSLVTCLFFARVRSTLNFQPSRAPRASTRALRAPERARARKCAAMCGCVRPCADFCPPFFAPFARE